MVLMKRLRRPETRTPMQMHQRFIKSSKGASTKELEVTLGSNPALWPGESFTTESAFVPSASAEAERCSDRTAPGSRIYRRDVPSLLRRTNLVTVKGRMLGIPLELDTASALILYGSALVISWIVATTASRPARSVVGTRFGNERALPRNLSYSSRWAFVHSALASAQESRRDRHGSCARAPRSSMRFVAAIGEATPDRLDSSPGWPAIRPAFAGGSGRPRSSGGLYMSWPSPEFALSRG